jgi:two-component system, OmpR family, KDP operon response regulator KdpE
MNGPAAPCVLLVDDERALRTVLRTRLKLAGYRVLEADTGEGALELLATETPDAMLLDLRLGDMDGWAVLEELRARGRLAGLRVVVVSAHGGPEIEGRARALGCRSVLQKPFALRDLVATLNQVIQAPA